MEVRTITEDEVALFRDTVMTTFGEEREGDPDGPERFRALVDPSQAWIALDGGTVVATAATVMLQIGVPGGGTLPIAGLTAAVVRPTHRRRGLLRALIGMHLDDARARGLAASGLWASEAAIYGRFGYGVAAFADHLEVAHAGSLVVAAGRELDDLAWIDEPAARALLPAVYARATADRPGALRRSPPWWHERAFLETGFARGGASRRRYVLARRAGEPVGYVVYRQRPGFTHGVASGTAEIVELIAVDPRAEATLWKLALGIDLFPQVTWWNAPTDTALPWIVDDGRRVRRQRVDNLWLRIEDVAAALAARRYPADGVLRFAIDDAVWELVVADGRGSCARTTHPAELRLGRAALGALYLGGVTASQLARAELVHADRSTLAKADALLASAIAPWCAEVF